MRLPLPPVILPAPKTEQARPFWSVMIPTYNPQADYLAEAIRGVLQQDPGPEQMQIQVVDDCSPNVDVEAIVKSIAKERVVFSKTPKNLGLAGCWNACIERANGEWVHILHQDDIVLPGFYAALRKGADDSQVGAMFSRHATVNPSGHWISLSHLHFESAGVLAGWREKIFLSQQIQCASIVVKRSVYENLGGFSPEFCFVLDWEMWRRISDRYLVWFEPSILACYRLHPSSATSKLRLEGGDIRDIRKLIEASASNPSGNDHSRATEESRQYYALLAVENSRELLVKGYPQAARKQIAEALRLSKRWPVLWQVISYSILRARIAGSRLKRRLKLTSS